MKNIIRNFLSRISLIRICISETRLSLKNKSKFKKCHLESTILVVAHSLEKGLGMKKIRKGYGRKKAQNLCQYIDLYIKKYGINNKYPLLESIGILKEYIKYQKQEKMEWNDLYEQYDKIISKLSDEQLNIINNYNCGVVSIKKEVFINNGMNKDFVRFISSRHSIREFAKKNVPEKDILKAIELSNMSPSACNRQPTKVYISSNSDEIKKYLNGNKAFTDDVDNFAIITCDREYFFGNEQYQWYINGGIYLSYFILALHSLGIGSCIMQWFAFDKNEKELKKLIGAKSTEAIIAVVCYGYYPEETKCLCAQRKPIEETLIKVK